jgi:hypothetical protein
MNNAKPFNNLNYTRFEKGFREASRNAQKKERKQIKIHMIKKR